LRLSVDAQHFYQLRTAFFKRSSLSVKPACRESYFWKKVFQKGDVSSPFLFDFTLEYVFGNVQEPRSELKLNGIYQLLVYAGDGKLVGRRTDIRYKKYKSIISCL
jgi:hypothetical protein